MPSNSTSNTRVALAPIGGWPLGPYARLEGIQAAELAELEKEEVRLANRRRALEKKQCQALERAQARSDEAQRSYRKAMKEWAE